MLAIRRFIDPYLMLLMGTVVLAALVPARGVWQTVADMSVTIAVAVLFFLYGARLAPSAVWAGITHWRLQTLVLATTYVFFPLLGLAIGTWADAWLQPDIAFGMLFLCLLPSTVQSSIAFTSIAGGNVPAALCSASISNMLGVVITPLLVALLLPTSGGGISLQALEEIALQILLPFVVGQAARPLIGTWLARHRLLTTVVDRGSILLVVYAAFSAGMVAGIWTQVSLRDLLAVMFFTLLVLAVVLGATTIASRKLGFSRQDEIAIVFCGSKKSMASGIPMAAILFPASALSLIVLPLMIFHQVQLFICAILARRYARLVEAGGEDKGATSQ
ncbi:bile acid:sodium symporter family protein [Pedomonas mirosovicensis]|uniref:bile acid:sodium symporter family protein n=1 Tax=Pedomonas mirosovicensis TaxID=2908641 RepID=UPI00216851D0|nr:bile acid:sodium symporter family protein [Pedomonas mirosovicensis]MCH8686637.1 bile acid:sodium symporter [Pedomonas mirosovicensis]